MEMTQENLDFLLELANRIVYEENCEKCSFADSCEDSNVCSGFVLQIIRARLMEENENG